MKRALPPFNYIVVADAVFRNGSFKGAASDLNVTPSAISHQVKGLEDWLGFELFSRGKKTIVTTPLGQAFLSRISEQLDGIEGATRDTLEARGAQQTLKVQTTDSFARMVLIKRVATLKQAQKKLRSAPIIRIATFEFTEGFQPAEADVAILYGNGEFGNAHVLFSRKENILPVCSPNLLTLEPPLIPADILAMPLITDYLLGTSWRHWCRFMDHEPTKADARQIDASLMVNHSHLAIEAAIDSQGVALVSDILAGDAILSGKLVPLTDQWLASDNGYHIVANTDSPHRSVEEFARWMADDLSFEVITST